jgi:hypothetical protein
VGPFSSRLRERVVERMWWWWRGRFDLQKQAREVVEVAVAVWTLCLAFECERGSGLVETHPRLVLANEGVVRLAMAITSRLDAREGIPKL